MKTKTILSYFSGLVVLVFVFSSCLKDNVEADLFHYTDEEYAILQQHLDLPRTPFDYRQRFRGSGFIPPFNDRQPTDFTDSKATLGRVLFFDKKLSLNESVSCESCHKQNLAFSDDVAFSKGFDGKLTKRNSIALSSVVNFETSYGGSQFVGASVAFFWDERAHSIDEQSRLTIQDDIEMGMDLDDLAARLSQEKYYQILFAKAYTTDEITPDRITDALQEFVNSITSFDSKFDHRFESGKDHNGNFRNFTAAENLGKRLFEQNCSSCHGHDMVRPARTHSNVANNGLDLEYADPGVGHITRRAIDDGKFKIPFLRNIELTGPYMHDGRFATLEEVIEHYNSGVQNHPNLDFRLKEDLNANPQQPRKLNLSEEEKGALVAFLKTLTDPTLLQDVKFSDPFK